MDTKKKDRVTDEPGTPVFVEVDELIGQDNATRRIAFEDLSEVEAFDDETSPNTFDMDAEGAVEELDRRFEEACAGENCLTVEEALIQLRALKEERKLREARLKRSKWDELSDSLDRLANEEKSSR